MLTCSSLRSTSWDPLCWPGGFDLSVDLSFLSRLCLTRLLNRVVRFVFLNCPLRGPFDSRFCVLIWLLIRLFDVYVPRGRTTLSTAAAHEKYKF